MIASMRKSYNQSMHQRRFTVLPELYPFADHWFDYQGAAIHYVDEGRGTPVLMLHGNPSWSFLYRDVIKSVKDACRAVAPDYPGFGFSEHPQGYRYTPREHAAAMEALIDHLQLKRFVLVVQDWGGPIGLSIATKRPDDITGLVILNTWAWPSRGGMIFFSHLMGDALGRFLHRRFNFFAKKIVPASIARADRKTPEVLKAYTDPFPTPESRIGTWVFPREIRMNDGWLGQTENGLAKLRDKPVEFVWAMKDPAFGQEKFIARWQSYFPGAPVDRVADASHFIQEDAPDRVAAAVKRVLGRIR
jgi:haloalkane dehalogenase